MLLVEDLCLHFKEKKLLTHLHCQFNSVGLVALMGQNGSGKTTFLKCLAQLLNIYSGKIQWQNSCLKTLDRSSLRKIIAYVPCATSPAFPFTVREMVSMGRFGLPQNLLAIQEALDFLDLTPLQNQNIMTLSSGELERVYLARALSAETPILLLDEPTNSLDFHFKAKLLQSLNELKKTKLIIAATHDMELKDQADFALLLKKGSVAYYGAPESLKLTANLT